MWRCDNVGGFDEHVTCHMFRFRSVHIYFIHGITRTARRLILATSMSHDVFPRKVSLGVAFILIYILGAKSPPPKKDPKDALNSLFQT